MAHPAATTRAVPFLVPGLLIAIAALSSAAFACVTPFAAFALAAAYALTPRTALGTIAGVWVANQAVGYAILAYPGDAGTISWGLAIGVAALVSTAIAGATLSHAGRNALVALAAGFVVAFAAYEAAMLPALLMLGGWETFTPSIIGQFALYSLLWAAGLIGGVEVLRRLGMIGIDRPALLPGAFVAATARR